jgi:hypothetical protein
LSLFHPGAPAHAPAAVACAVVEQMSWGAHAGMETPRSWVKTL